MTFLCACCARRKAKTNLNMYDMEPDNQYDFDADKDMEEPGTDWEDMEREAAAVNDRCKQASEWWLTRSAE